MPCPITSAHSLNSAGEHLARVDHVVTPRLPISALNDPKWNIQKWNGIRKILGNTRYYGSPDTWWFSIPNWVGDWKKCRVAGGYQVPVGPWTQSLYNFKMQFLQKHHHHHNHDDRNVQWSNLANLLKLAAAVKVQASNRLRCTSFYHPFTPEYFIGQDFL